MIGLWAIFTVMLSHRRTNVLACVVLMRAPSAIPTTHFALRRAGHRVLSLVAVVTVLGAVGGAHGALFGSQDDK